MSHSLGKWLFTTLVVLTSGTAYGQYGLDNGQVGLNNGQAGWFQAQTARPNTQPGWNNSQPNLNYAQYGPNNIQPNLNYAQSGWNNAQSNGNYAQPGRYNAQPGVNNNIQPYQNQPVWNGPTFGQNNVNPSNVPGGWQIAQPNMSNVQPIWNSAQPGLSNTQPIGRNAQFGQNSIQPSWNPTPTPLESLPTATAWPRIAQTPNTVAMAYGPNAGTAAPVQAAANTVPYNCSDACAGGCQSGCTSCAPCRAPCRWYAAVGGLMMGRDRSRRVWTTYETNNNSNQLTNTREIDSEWRGGMEFHLGRKICCGTWAIDLGYWTLEDFEASTSQTHANSVSSPLQFNDLEFATGVPVVDYFDSAMEHRLSRRNSVHNVELNLIENHQCCQSSCSPWTCQKILGLRYFRFDEDLVFSTLDQGGTWGGNGGLDEATLEDSIENHLLGAQLGCQWLRRIGCRGSFFITPKFGVYNNHINNRFDLRRGDGTAAMPTSFSNVSGSYPVSSSTDEISFLSELNLGMSWQPTCRCSIFGGYRVLVLSGVGTADSQIPQYIVDIPEIADIDYNDALVLQGVFAGASYSF